MEFKEAVRSVLGQYANFSGRASRSEYWWWTLFTVIVYFAFYFLIFLASFIFPPSVSPDGTVSAGLGAIIGLVLFVLLLAAMLALLIPSLAVLVRRLHDTDRSAWWILAGFIPFVGGLILIVLCVLESDAGSNQYGPPAGSALAWGSDPDGDPQSTEGAEAGAVGPPSASNVAPGDNRLSRQRAKVRSNLPHMPATRTLPAPRLAYDQPPVPADSWNDTTSQTSAAAPYADVSAEQAAPAAPPAPTWPASAGTGGEPQPAYPQAPHSGQLDTTQWPQPPQTPEPEGPPPLAPLPPSS